MPIEPETPPRKSLIRRIGKWGILLAGVLFLLILVGFFVERKRGRKVWERFRAEWESKGEVFELKPLLEIPATDEDNYAKADLFMEAGFADDLSELASSLAHLKGMEAGGWSMQGRWPWDPNVEARPTEGELKEGERLIAGWKNDLDRVAEAGRRPGSLFVPVDENYLTAARHYLTPQRHLAEIFFLRAMLALREEKTSPALVDGATLVRMGRHLERNGCLIDYLFGAVVDRFWVQLVWEGLADRKWDEDALMQWERLAVECNQLEQFLQVMRRERAGSLQFFEDLTTKDLSQMAPVGVGGPNFLPPFFPKGWVYQNMLTMARHQQETLFAPEGRVIRKLHVRHLLDQPPFERGKGFLPHRFLAEMAMPSVGTVSRTAVQREATVRLLRLGIALERYRLKNGAYPNALIHLAPEFLETLPMDPITNKSMVYKLENDRFQLYSHGLNRVDDGGVPDKQKDKGDWVWAYPDG
ncbi:MAG: hypothetical protein AAF514_03435 [Verrucomicrobiota bacterium]